jgi:hypothetical protein
MPDTLFAKVEDEPDSYGYGYTTQWIALPKEHWGSPIGEHVSSYIMKISEDEVT